MSLSGLASSWPDVGDAPWDAIVIGAGPLGARRPGRHGAGQPLSFDRLRTADSDRARVADRGRLPDHRGPLLLRGRDDFHGGGTRGICRPGPNGRWEPESRDGAPAGT